MGNKCWVPSTSILAADAAHLSVATTCQYNTNKKSVFLCLIYEDSFKTLYFYVTFLMYILLKFNDKLMSVIFYPSYTPQILQFLIHNFLPFRVSIRLTPYSQLEGINIAGIMQFPAHASDVSMHSFKLLTAT
jgi:hypothetical protein